MPQLTLDALKGEASSFLNTINAKPIRELFGVTDGKAVGTYVEHQLHEYLSQRYTYTRGSSASGIDFPDLGVDLKVTSVRQPQSSSPFKSAYQKVYGLGYHLIVFVYDKHDDVARKASLLTFSHAIFIAKERTADYQTTSGILEILRRNGNIDDIMAFLEERHLPLDEIGRRQLAEQILANPPKQGYLTVSNALQWRLQYGHVIKMVSTGNTVEGVEDILGARSR